MSKLSKAVEELNNMAKSHVQAKPDKNDAARSSLTKAFKNLSKAANRLSKGIDFDAKDYESSNLDAYDTVPRGHRGPRQAEDRGNQYSGMVPTPRENEDWNTENAHRVIVTGKPVVHGGHSDNEDWEDPEDPDVGDPEFYHRTRHGRPNDEWEDESYDKSFGHEKAEGKEEKRHSKKMKKMHEGDEGYEEGEDAEKSFGGEEYIYDQLLESPEFAEIVESTPVVEHIADVMGKSYGEIMEELYDLRKALTSMCVAQAEVMKSLGMVSEDAKLAKSKPGIVGVMSDRTYAPMGNIPVPSVAPNAAPMAKANSATAPEERRQWYANTLRNLEAAANEGAITPSLFEKVASGLDSGGDVLKSIPEAIRKQYSIEG